MACSVSWHWKSKFARFIQDYGVESLLLNSMSAAPRFTSGFERRPRPDQPTPKPFSVSPANADRLTMDEIYRHSCEVRADLHRRMQNSARSHGNAGCRAAGYGACGLHLRSEH